jgi:hypothetical protein
MEQASLSNPGHMRSDVGLLTLWLEQQVREGRVSKEGTDNSYFTSEPLEISKNN